MNSAESFSADYQTARAKFRDAAVTAGGALEAIEYPERGPGGEMLFTDVGQFGPRHPEKLLVLISGTHGVEGFCGSGAQVDLLRRGETRRLPAGVGMLMIHAINPYGFAWLRRVTHENVDLNRNWVDFAQPLPENPDYAALSEAICPRDWDGAARAEAERVLADYVAREGAQALNQAMSGGQYHFPDGVFYGGTEPTWSRRTQETILGHYCWSSSAIAIIDYHTGIGPWGFAEQITTLGRDTDAFARAARWYGAALRTTVDGSAAAARIGGDGMTGAAKLLQHATVAPVALEVGTLARDQVRLALRADTWLHAHGDPASPLAAAIKREIRNAYYGDADDWKGMVAGQSLIAVRQAIAGLGQSAENS